MNRASVAASSILDRVLVLEMVRVTEAAAIAASAWIGRGDNDAADDAAVEAMRAALNELPIDGTVVIGEGERDEAPMLYIGEKVGSAQDGGPEDRHRARPAGRHDADRDRRARTRWRCWRSPKAAACSTRPTSTCRSWRSGRATRKGRSTSTARPPTTSARWPRPRASSRARSSPACSTGRGTRRSSPSFAASAAGSS